MLRYLLLIASAAITASLPVGIRGNTGVAAQRRSTNPASPSPSLTSRGCDFRKILQEAGFDIHNETIELKELPHQKDGTPFSFKPNSKITTAQYASNAEERILPGSVYTYYNYSAFESCIVGGMDLRRYQKQDFKGALFGESIFKSSSFINSNIQDQIIIGGESIKSNISNSKINESEIFIRTMLDEISGNLHRLFPYDTKTNSHILDQELYTKVEKIFSTIAEINKKTTIITDSNIKDSVIYRGYFNGITKIDDKTLIYASKQDKNSQIINGNNQIVTLNTDIGEGLPQNPPPQKAKDFAKLHNAIIYSVIFSENISEELQNKILKKLELNFEKFGIIFTKHDPNTKEIYGELKISAVEIENKSILGRAGSIALFPPRGTIEFNTYYSEDKWIENLLHETFHQILGGRHKLEEEKILNIKSGTAKIFIPTLGLLRKDPINLAPEIENQIRNLVENGLGIDLRPYEKNVKPHLLSGNLRIHYGNMFKLDVNSENNEKTISVKKVDDPLFICYSKGSCGEFTPDYKLYLIEHGSKEDDSKFLVLTNEGELTITINNSDTGETKEHKINLSEFSWKNNLYIFAPIIVAAAAGSYLLQKLIKQSPAREEEPEAAGGAVPATLVAPRNPGAPQIEPLPAPATLGAQAASPGAASSRSASPGSSSGSGAGAPGTQPTKIEIKSSTTTPSWQGRTSSSSSNGSQISLGQR